MSQLEWLNQAVQNFALEAHPVLVGFDGFVDDIVHLVGERQSTDQFTRLEKMGEFSSRVEKAIGKSCNIEMHVTQSKLGGNGPIMANALAALGKSLTYVGSIGKEKVHPVFAEFSEKCKEVVLMAEPGHTHAIEFFDGKVMMGKIQSLDEINWETMKNKVGEAKLEQLLRSVSLIACVNWTMIPYMNSILKGMGEMLSKLGIRKTIFVDLTDPRKRPLEDLREVLKILQELQVNSDIILGLNEAESNQVSEVLELETTDMLQERALRIKTKLDLHMVVVHPVRGAAIACEAGSFEVDGPFTSTPNLTTGAGDNFNAGFCAGLLAGLEPAQCLLTGVCTSGFYVRHCHSPSHRELVDFMKSWYSEGCGPI